MPSWRAAVLGLLSSLIVTGRHVSGQNPPSTLSQHDTPVSTLATSSSGTFDHVIAPTSIDANNDSNLGNDFPAAGRIEVSETLLAARQRQVDEEYMTSQGIAAVLLAIERGLEAQPVNRSEVGSLVRRVLRQDVEDAEVATAVMQLLELQVSKKNASDMEQCLHDLGLYVGSLMNRTLWAVRMFDATGRPAPGLQTGNTVGFGTFHECLSIGRETRGVRAPVKGGYYAMLMRKPRHIFIPDIQNGMLGEYNVEWHLCLPDSCPASGLATLVSDERVMGMPVLGVVSRQPPKSLAQADRLTILTLASIGIAVLLVLLSTTFDIVSGIVRKCRHHRKAGTADARVHCVHGNAENGVQASPRGQNDRSLAASKPGQTDGEERYEAHEDVEMEARPTSGVSKDSQAASSHSNNNTSPHEDSELASPTNAHDPTWWQVLLAFSLPGNLRKVMGTRHQPDSLRSLHGLRVLSFSMVVAGHMWYSRAPLISDFTANTHVLTGLLGTVMFRVDVAIDSFFVLGGLLVAYLFLKTVEQNQGKVTCRQMLLYYVHRYSRLTPAYAAVIACYATLMPYLTGGPLDSSRVSPDYLECRSSWWANLLYIHNLYPTRGHCMGSAWYLSADFQFYALAPLVLVPLALCFYKTGVFLIFSLIGVHIASNYAVVATIDDANTGSRDVYFGVYIKPYSRVGPYAMGMLVGWILQRTKCKPRLPPVAVIVGWLVAVAMVVAFLAVPMPGNRMGQWVEATHRTFKRLVWSFFFSWVTFACCSGYGGYLQSLLSWEGWLPLSRLTYAAYLVHLMVLMVSAANMQYLVPFSQLHMFLLFLGLSGLIYLIALVLSLLVEAPSLQLEKALLGKVLHRKPTVKS